MKSAWGLIFLAMTGLVFSSCGTGNTPLYGNAPGTVSSEKNLAAILRLYPTAKSRNMPWAGYWWPYADNSMLPVMSSYSSAVGNSAAVRWEEAHHGSTTPGIQSWYGHCNGWAAASVMFHEPTQPYQDASGVFSVADQKALLSEMSMEVNGDFFGTPTTTDNPGTLAYQDVFPNQFLLVLTNYVGQGLPLVMDRYTGDQVWNQPVAGYRITQPGPSDVLPYSPAAPHVTRLKMTVEVWWARDDVDAEFITQPFNFTTSESYESRVFDFEAWLDGPVEFASDGKVSASGNLILTRQGSSSLGGYWLMSGVESYPDYLWVPYQPKESTGFSNPNLDFSWLRERFAR